MRILGNIASQKLGSGSAFTLLICAACAAPAERGIPAVPLPEGTPSAHPETVSPLTRGVEFVRDRVGAFLIQVERDTVRFRGMHVHTGWTKVHLSFTTPDERVNIALTDNGAALRIDARTSTSCFLTSFYYQYGGSEDGSHLYDAMADVLQDIVEACPRGMEAGPEYQRALELARADFPEAMRAMMAKVSIAYGERLVRCENPPEEEKKNPLVGMQHGEDCLFD